jgi:hypothetical protein
LDAGRGIILGQRLDVRDELKGLPEDFVQKFRDLQSILDPPLNLKGTTTSKTDRPTARDLHQIALDFRALQKEIRSINGFQYFGLPLPELELMKQATQGAIVILNVNPLRCDALIVREGGIRNLPLNKVTFGGVSQHIESFYSAIKEITRPVKSKYPIITF